MNKELEEAIKSLKSFAYTIHGTFSVKEAKVILNYIENSIPTETIKDKKQKLEKEYKEVLENNSTKAFIIKCQLELIDELL